MEGVELEVRTPASGGRQARSRAQTGARACARSWSRSCSTRCTSCRRWRSEQVVVDEQMISADGKPLLIYSDQHKVAAAPAEAP